MGGATSEEESVLRAADDEATSSALLLGQCAWISDANEQCSMRTCHCFPAGGRAARNTDKKDAI